MNKSNDANIDWRLAPVFSIVIGLFAFLTVVGPRALFPRNIAWLGQGDPATHYLGWLFFRHSEWSFPIGLNPKYGLELSNSILFSDSNPLLAFLFKPFSQFLPETFQYFGIWLLACFILQAFFAFKLINLVTKSPALCALGACLFLFAPPMLWRLNGHLSLNGHFFIVASLYLTLHPAPKQRILWWVVLLVTSALTHAYLLAMVGLIWTADILGRLINKTLPYNRAAIEFPTILLAIFLACWQTGYFSVGDAVSSWGFGFYRMNLLSILDPSGWSYMLRDIPEAAGDYEGFNYLGLGMIFLGICSIPVLINSQTRLLHSIIIRPTLLIVMAGFSIFAISNKLGIASTGVEYELPDFLIPIFNTFRSSGRMFWPVFYIFYFTIIFLVIRGYSKRVAVTLLGLGLVIQIADTSAAWLDIRKKLMTAPSSNWHTTMASPFWDEAASKYSSVRSIPPGMSANWQAIAGYAGTHGLATDAVYLARASTAALEVAQQKSTNTLIFAEFEPTALYFLDESQLEKVARTLDPQNDLLAQIDGFTVVAPGWKKCASCSTVAGEVNVSDHLPTRLRLGERMAFSQYQVGPRYLLGGWSQQEGWETWSDGSDAAIILPIESEQASTILMEANPLLSPSHLKQVVEIKINGIPTNSATLTADSGGRFEVVIPEVVQNQLRNTPILRLQLHFPNAVRPVDIGINSDGRKLAIGLVALTVQ